jgi:hypothetical protein
LDYDCVLHIVKFAILYYLQGVREIHNGYCLFRESLIDTQNLLVIYRVFGRYTMDVISALGFGMDTDCQTNPDNAFVKYAKELFSIRYTPLLVCISKYHWYLQKRGKLLVLLMLKMLNCIFYSQHCHVLLSLLYQYKVTVGNTFWRSWNCDKF